MRKTHRCDVPILLVLLAPSRNSQEEDNDPRNANFCPHLQVNGADSRVQGSTHEDIIQEIPGHSHLCPGGDRNKVHPKRHSKTIYHSHGHDMAIVIDDFGQAENARDMEERGGSHCGP